MQDNLPSIEQLPNETEFKVRSENIGFEASQLLTCSGCGRQNAPNRLRCLYCSHELEIVPEQAELIRPKFQAIESEEIGFNVVVSEQFDRVGSSAAEISSFTGIDPAQIAAAAESQFLVPLMRVGLRSEAEFVVRGLGRLGIDASIINDASLMPDRSPIRLRSIDLFENEVHFIEFNGEELHTLKPADLALIVTGVLAETKTDQVEKRSRRKDPKIVENVQTGSDEAVLDLYTRDDPVGFRVRMAGFDFSCLGPEKGFLATENIIRLGKALEQLSPAIRVAGNYGNVRHALGRVWPVDVRRDTKGVQRGGFGKVDVASTMSSSNVRQFNKYSRLQWHLL